MHNDTMTLPTQPTVAQLDDAVARLQLRPSDETAALLHLSLPVDSPVGLAAWRDGSMWVWRNRHLPDGADARQVAAFVARGVCDGDVFHDLTDPDAALQHPGRWGKPVRTGARLVMFGTDLLFDAPVVAGRAGVDAGDLRELLRMWRADGQITVPGVTTVNGRTLLLAGSHGWVVATNA